MVHEIRPEDDASEVALTVRVPKDILERIDSLVKARPTKIPRHSWLLEAIHEKLYKEERVEGTLNVSREIHEERDAPTKYRLRFLRPDRIKMRPIAPMDVVGDDCLAHYLVEWGCTSENARGWIQTLKGSRSISIPDIMMPADRVGRYGFKVPPGGINLDLGDDKEAYLIPDHPAMLPDGNKGDKIEICSRTGGKNAWVMTNGKVLIIGQEHWWPPDEPNSVKITYWEGSEEETKEILSVYRQYMVD